MSYQVRPVAAEAVRPLRLQVLRPGQPAEAAVYPGDDDPNTRHVALVDTAGKPGGGDRVVGVASWYFEQPSAWRQRLPEAMQTQDWQLRAMAIDPDYQGQGLGAVLLKGCLTVLAATNVQARWLWCAARQKAASFYERQGFSRLSEAFDVPGIGPHYLMGRPWPAPGTRV